jgi:hypothetical protein
MKTMKDFEEGLVRYKKYYPHICEGRTDIEILLYRNLITEKQAEELLKPPKIPTSNAGGAGKEVKPREPKIRPYTQKQVEKMGKDAAKDFLGDNPDAEIDAGIAYDMAKSMLLGEERLQAYFKKCGIDKKNWAEAFADYIAG